LIERYEKKIDRILSPDKLYVIESYILINQMT